MKTKTFFTALLLTLLSLNTLMAQPNKKRFAFELSGGASLATSKPGKAELRPGFGFEGTFHYRIAPFAGIYAGWGWNRFGSDESFAGEKNSFEETGYVLGVQYLHPISGGPLSYDLRAGALYNHIEIERAQGDIVGDTGHGFGYQLAAGISYNLGKNWSLAPGIKFNALTRDLKMESSVTELKHNYVSLRIGIVKRF